jgi:site-specific DNA recombinase
VLAVPIEQGHHSRALSDRLAALERQQHSLRAQLSEMPPTSVRLHPRLADVYAEKVQQLEVELNDPAVRDEATDLMRSLIDRIELHPRDCGEGVDALLHGALAQILTLCVDVDGKRKLPKPGSQLSVVAGARSHLYRTLVHYERNAQK